MRSTSTQDKLNQHPLIWQTNNLKIINKDGKLIRLRHNIAQLKVYKAIEAQQKLMLPVRLIILKARQMGISTFIEAMIFMLTYRIANRFACIVSADQEATNKIFRMAKLFLEELNPSMQRPTDYSSRKEIVYSKPHRSSLLTQTAGKEVLGRGGTSHYIHASEVAFWNDAETQLLGLMQELPETQDSLCSLESTANGVGGAFHTRYWNAVERLQDDPQNLRGFLPIFLPWHNFPEYQTPLPEHWDGVIKLNEEEREIQCHYQSIGIDLTQEQWFWRRTIIADKCDGNIDMFKQEYPSTAREAFQFTGRPVFKIWALDKHSERTKEATEGYWEFYHEYDHYEGSIKRRRVLSRDNAWSVWKWPQSNHEYCFFGDVAEGRAADPKGPKPKPDRSVCGILDRNTMEVVAVYYGRINTLDYGAQMIAAAKAYNYAWGSPEINSAGEGVLNEFKKASYPNLYQRETQEQQIVERISDLLGWKTTVGNRKTMIATLDKIVEEFGITIYDARVIHEMYMFIENNLGKPEALQGEHDDCVMMLAGLVQMHLRCPMNGDELEQTNVAQRTDDAPVANIACANAIDTELEDEDDDDDIW